MPPQLETLIVDLCCALFTAAAQTLLDYVQAQVNQPTVVHVGAANPDDAAISDIMLDDVPVTLLPGGGRVPT